MNRFWSLFTAHRQYRYFARVDQAGICRALKHCVERPVGGEWVEITEQRLSWLNQPLPVSARVNRTQSRPTARRLLTA